jgi:hypothetical protein
MSEEILDPTPVVKKKKTVSFSQFSNWWTCPHKWYRDYILHEKEFEDNLIMTFGTAIHETIQHYLKTLYDISDEAAEKVDTQAFFLDSFKKQIAIKKIPHTQIEFDEFVEDGKNIMNEFKDPSNRIFHFPRDKWTLLAIEDKIEIDIFNNVVINGLLDIVLQEKLSGNIRIIDFKTSTNGWTKYQKEDFTKTSQLVLYKTLYSKKYNVPLSKITVEFFILKRKLYDESKTAYAQSRIQIFKPSSFQKDVNEVIQEFTKFVNACFTTEGVHKTDSKYPKNPGKNKKNCKYCPYLKNKKCDGRAELIE